MSDLCCRCWETDSGPGCGVRKQHPPRAGAPGGCFHQMLQMLSRIRDRAGAVVDTSLVVSVSTMLLYDTAVRRSRWPDGQVKLPADSGPTVMVAMTRPFLGSNDALPDTWPAMVRLLAADGFLLPPLMQAYVAVAAAVSV